MRLTAILIAAALAAIPAAGQNSASEAKPQPALVDQNPLEAEIIHVKTLTGDSFDRLVKLLSVFQARLQSDQQLRTIIVYAPKDVVAQMRRVVAELDTPGSEAAIGRNIEMTLTFLRASSKAPTTPRTLPDDIEPVAKQLRATTQYKDIQLWDVMPMRLQEGKQTTSEVSLPALDSGASSVPLSQYTLLSLGIEPDSATRKDRGWSVRFKTMSLSFRIPVLTGVSNGPDGKSIPQFSFQNLGLKTAGDFLEGQKTVLGKVSGGETDGAIFVVVSLKVLD